MNKPPNNEVNDSAPGVGAQGAEGENLASSESFNLIIPKIYPTFNQEARAAILAGVYAYILGDCWGKGGRGDE